MKARGLTRSFGVLLVASVSLFFLQSANAVLLFSEAFNYTSGTGLPGSTNPGNTTAWSSGNSTRFAIGSGNLTYAGLADLSPSGNDLVLGNGSASSTINTFTPQTSGQIYYSFLFNPTAVNGGNQYFTALNPGTTAPGGSGDAIDAYYYTDGKIYLRANAQGATAGTGSALTLGQTYLIVEMVDLTAKTASLWIDPDSSTFGDTAPTAAASLSSITATSVANVGFKSQSTAGGPYTIDTLRIGTTWADVTPAVVVPEPSSLALAAAGIGLMLGMIRRRRS
ncbi:MAG TPA: PEP-CTERM sorting domain-containing protein [Verrucomicrobiae bacterium]|nr:PEP-CTERM sorting domain-containing protein [Verrucomicrobiae bacterium]